MGQKRGRQISLVIRVRLKCPVSAGAGDGDIGPERERVRTTVGVVEHGLDVGTDDCEDGTRLDITLSGNRA